MAEVGPAGLAAAAVGLFVLTMFQRRRGRRIAMTVALSALGLQMVLTVAFWQVYL